MESKWSIYNLLPPVYYPRTLFYNAGTNVSMVLEEMKNLQLSFPVIGKPDIGMKGMAVARLHNADELEKYITNSPVDFLVQELVEYKNEAGIFYYRFPNENRGRISGIVGKEFLAVKGDGTSSIKELLKRDKRHVLQLRVLVKTYGEELERILMCNEEIVLVPYGNHVRGAKFIDISDRITEELTSVIDHVCREVKGFYYGRLDIRYNSWEELTQGLNFSVIELNGAGSEPTHIYDPRHSIFFAWREIIRHWKILWKISRINHHQVHQPYMNTREGLKMLKDSSRYIKLVNGK